MKNELVSDVSETVSSNERWDRTLRSDVIRLGVNLYWY
jgi:hypothetical protein